MLSQIYDYVLCNQICINVSSIKSNSYFRFSFPKFKNALSREFWTKNSSKYLKKSNLFNPLWLRRFVDRSTYHFKVRMKRRSLGSLKFLGRVDITCHANQKGASRLFIRGLKLVRHGRKRQEKGEKLDSNVYQPPSHISGRTISWPLA